MQNVLPAACSFRKTIGRAAQLLLISLRNNKKCCQQRRGHLTCDSALSTKATVRRALTCKIRDWSRHAVSQFFRPIRKKIIVDARSAAGTKKRTASREYPTTTPWERHKMVCNQRSSPRCRQHGLDTRLSSGGEVVVFGLHRPSRR